MFTCRLILLIEAMMIGNSLYYNIGSSNCLVRENGNPRVEIDSFRAKTAVVKYLREPPVLKLHPRHFCCIDIDT